MFDGILFDLDGTLWDAVPQVTESWNRTLERQGVDRVLTVADLRPCMGMLLSDIGGRLLPGVDGARREELIAVCCADENDYLAQHGAALFPHEEEVLSLLAGKCPLFVVSNCQDGYIEAFYTGTGLGKYFSGCECAGHTGLLKSGNIKLMVERHGLKNPVYVGDTMLDYTSARDAGVPFLHAAYGFGTVENVPAVQTFAELPEALRTLSGPV